MLIHNEHWGFLQLLYLNDLENLHADNIQDPENIIVNRVKRVLFGLLSPMLLLSMTLNHHV